MFDEYFSSPGTRFPGKPEFINKRAKLFKLKNKLLQFCGNRGKCFQNIVDGFVCESCDLETLLCVLQSWNSTTHCFNSNHLHKATPKASDFMAPELSLIQSYLTQLSHSLKCPSFSLIFFLLAFLTKAFEFLFATGKSIKTCTSEFGRKTWVFNARLAWPQICNFWNAYKLPEREPWNRRQGQTKH